MTNPNAALEHLRSREFQSILQELEDKRILLRRRLLHITALTLPTLVIFGFLLGQLLGKALQSNVTGSIVEFLSLLGAMLGLTAAAITIQRLFNPQFEKYRKQFKHQVIQRLIKHYKPDLVYNAIGGIPKEEFVNSRIFNLSIDRYHCEDLLKGKIGATIFRSSEAHAEHKGNDDMNTVFQGLFFVASFNKSFNGHTIVKSNVIEQMLRLGKGGSRTRTKQLDGLSVELVQLEDPEFTRLYTVFSTDQVEARYILSTSLMQRLIDFLNLENGRPTLTSRVGVNLAFLRSKVYIAIPLGRSYFEPPSLWATPNQKIVQDIENYLADIKLAEDIINDLNLNRRIWGKK